MKNILRVLSGAFWYDSEFTGLSADADLISFGCIGPDGRSFYAVLSDADLSKATEWVWRNVLPTLAMPEQQVEGETFFFGSQELVKEAFLGWLHSFPWLKNGKYTNPLVIQRPTYDWILLDRLLGQLNPWKYSDVLDYHTSIAVTFGERVSFSSRSSGIPHNAVSDARTLREDFLSRTK